MYLVTWLVVAEYKPKSVWLQNVVLYTTLRWNLKCYEIAAKYQTAYISVGGI